jgi:hypothetical protein
LSEGKFPQKNLIQRWQGWNSPELGSLTTMGKIIASSLFLFCANPVLAQQQSAVWLSGIGSMSCAHWRSTAASRNEGMVWVLGFWTALNYVAAVEGVSQSKIDSETILAEVSKTCGKGLSKTLATAAWETFVALTKR